MDKTGLTADEITDRECFGDTGHGKAYNIRLVTGRNGFRKPYYVGDTEGDRLAAREAGAGFIAADYGFGAPAEADFRITGFKQLIELMG